jgi:putative transposase
MGLGRPWSPLVLNDEEFEELKGMAKSRSFPHSLVQRAKIVLA